MTGHQAAASEEVGGAHDASDNLGPLAVATDLSPRSIYAMQAAVAVGRLVPAWGYLGMHDAWNESSQY